MVDILLFNGLFATFEDTWFVLDKSGVGSEMGGDRGLKENHFELLVGYIVVVADVVVHLPVVLLFELDEFWCVADVSCGWD